eukprot:764782-Hanusia_phi.AAC.2
MSGWRYRMVDYLSSLGEEVFIQLLPYLDSVRICFCAPAPQKAKQERVSHRTGLRVLHLRFESNHGQTRLVDVSPQVSTLATSPVTITSARPPDLTDPPCPFQLGEARHDQVNPTGNSGTIGEVLDDSNCLSNERRTERDSDNSTLALRVTDSRSRSGPPRKRAKGGQRQQLRLVFGAAAGP